MPPAARALDTTTHGLITGPCSPNTNINSRPACRLLDPQVCPHGVGQISVGSGTVFVNSLPASRVGDIAVCMGPAGVVTTGSPNVNIGG